MRRKLLHGRWAVQVWKDENHYIDNGRGLHVPKPLTFEFDNGITDVGIHYLLDAGFRGSTAISAWYAGLIDNSGYSAVAGSDTMSSHAGWAEATQYDESVRQTLSFPSASSRSISAQVSFTMNATKTIQGIFVTSDSTKSGTTGTLWSTALFSSPPSLVSGNVLTATYTLSD